MNAWMPDKSPDANRNTGSSSDVSIGEFSCSFAYCARQTANAAVSFASIYKETSGASGEDGIVPATISVNRKTSSTERFSSGHFSVSLRKNSLAAE